MSKGALLYEGNARKIFQTDNPRMHLVEFTDGPGSYDGTEREFFDARANLRNTISFTLMGMLEKNDVPTYFIREDGSDRMEVRALARFPIDVVCYNAAGGSFMNRMALTEGELLPLTVIEFFIEPRSRGGSPAGAEAIREIKTITDGDVRMLQTRALMANHYMKEFLYEKGLVLAEIKFEFGRDPRGLIRISGEISPDTCRLWDRADYEKIDKDRFRKEIGIDESSYRQAAKMLTD